MSKSFYYTVEGAPQKPVVIDLIDLAYPTPEEIAAYEQERIKQALDELKRWRERYHDMEEFSELFAFLDRAEGKPRKRGQADPEQWRKLKKQEITSLRKLFRSRER